MDEKIESIEKIHEAKKDYSTYNRLIEPDSGIKNCDINKWRQAAIIVAVLSTIASFAIGITETVVAKVEDSSAAFALAFTAILDALTSVVVCWRFFKEADIYSQRKEHIACIIFGIVIIGSAMGTAAKCIFGLVDGETPDLSDSGERIILITSVTSAVTCFIIFVVNVIIAKKLVSWVIFSDALDSLVGGIIATSIVITSEVTKYNPQYWYLDETIGLITSVLLTAYGIWLSIKHCQHLEEMGPGSSISPKCGVKCHAC